VQALTAENGLIELVYPVNTEKYSLEQLQSFVVNVQIDSPEAIRSVYSPSHPVEIEKDGTRAEVTYEAQNVLPDKDFHLFYSIGENTAIHLLSFRDPEEVEDEDGYFLLMLAPEQIKDNEIIEKDILLVVDKSGSMDGEKIIQAKNAMRFILENLNPGDRFYMNAFSSNVTTFDNALRPASDAEAGIEWINRLSAMGSTDLNRGLLEAAASADPERPTYLILLSDGLPTEGVTEVNEILRSFEQNATDNLRVFPFGVGYDVDTNLLDMLSENFHGLSTYVLPGEMLDESLSAFYSRISTPVMTNIALDFGKMQVYDVFPNPLPDLFAESQVIITGRYADGGETDIVLKGYIGNDEHELVFSEQYFEEDSRGKMDSRQSLAQIWAARKIGYLLKQVRLNGPEQETIDQIVRLSIRFGIVTPYTSYLVTEPVPFGEERQSSISEQVFMEMEAAPAEPSFGRDAVNKAAAEGALSQADYVETYPDRGAEMQTVKQAGSKTYVFSEGIWIDTSFDPKKMPVQTVEFLSDAYFKLAAARPEIGAALALGNQVILVVDQEAYQVVMDGAGTAKFILPEIIVDDHPSQMQMSSEDREKPDAITGNGNDDNSQSVKIDFGKDGIWKWGLLIGMLGFILVLSIIFGYKRK
jgi:Ca-activated chloride channel family protein